MDKKSNSRFQRGDGLGYVKKVTYKKAQTVTNVIGDLMMEL